MWKKYDEEFKRNALQKVFDGQSVRSVSQELGVNESQIHKWKKAALKKGNGVQTGAELAETQEMIHLFPDSINCLPIDEHPFFFQHCPNSPITKSRVD